MTGTEQYNDNFDSMSRKRIAENCNKGYLAGFYDYLLVDTSYSGSYGYLGCVINFVNYIDLINPKDITMGDYTKFLANIKSKSSSYKIMVYSALKKFSSYLMANYNCEDYMQFIKRPKFKESIKTKKKREIGYMTEDEVKLFLKNIENSNKPDCWKARDLAMAKVLLNSGIRCSALQKLDVNDVDFKKKTIEVLEKGEEAREIFLSDKTMLEIKNWIEYRSELVSDKENALFISNHKCRIGEKTIYNTIKSYGMVIDGKNITPHKTRSTYGTMLYNTTHDLFFVQENMGHASPKTTELYIRGQKKNNAKRASKIMVNVL